MIVIDTSVAGKWILVSEQDSAKAKQMIIDHISGKQLIVVPDLFFYEIANTLVTKSLVSPWKMTNFLTKTYQFNLKVYYLTETDLKNATRLARKYGTTIYDMIYAVVAKKHRTRLITADERFVKATKFHFVKLLQDI